MRKKLFAFDLDGTLLNSDKIISTETVSAIREMHGLGHLIVLASGRLGSSLMRYEPILNIPFSTVTLNGAAAYSGGAGKSTLIFNMPLQKEYSNELISYYKEKSESASGEKDFSINFYHNDTLYTENKNEKSEWVKLYINETSSEYEFVSDLNEFSEKEPEKILFCGKSDVLDKVESKFRSKWDSQVYIVRTWDRYLEFLHKDVNKAVALQEVALIHGIEMNDVVAFGDGDNDAPMLKSAGLGIAVKNGTKLVKESANKISKYSNDENVIAEEWKLIKRSN